MVNRYILFGSWFFLQQPTTSHTTKQQSSSSTSSSLNVWRRRRKKKYIFLNKNNFSLYIKNTYKQHYPVCMTSYKIYILHFSRPPKIYLTDTIPMQCHTELKVRVNYKQKRICAIFLLLVLLLFCCFSDFKKLILFSSYG